MSTKLEPYTFMLTDGGPRSHTQGEVLLFCRGHELEANLRQLHGPDWVGSDELHVWVLTPIRMVVKAVEVTNIEVALEGLEGLAEKAK